MDEDDILYQSIIANPETVPSDVDISGLRTETETNPELLASVSEFPGLQFDPTQYSSYEDLYDLYSRGLPMVETPETDTITTPVVETPITDTSAGDQVTGDLTTDLTTDPINTGAQQNLIDQGIGVQGAIGDPVVAPGEAPVTQQEIDEFNFPALTQDSTAGDISQDLANQQVMLDPTGGNIMDEVALTGGDTGILDTAVSGVSTAARNAFEAVKSGASTAANFITTYGYPVYQALQGNLVAAGASVATGLTPLILGTNFVGKIFESVGDTKSKQEYDSYSSEQQSEIDKAYGPGGVMEGYNAVSQFGEGPKATIQSRLDTRRANGISDSSPISQQLIELQNNLGITDFTQLTQDDISDRDDIDPTDVGLIAAGSADVQDFADIMPDELPDVTITKDNAADYLIEQLDKSLAIDAARREMLTPKRQDELVEEQNKIKRNITNMLNNFPETSEQVLADRAEKAQANVEIDLPTSPITFEGDSDSAPTGVDAGTADVQDFADIMPDELPDVTDPIEDFEVSGDIGQPGQVLDTLLGPSDTGRDTDVQQSGTTSSGRGRDTDVQQSGTTDSGGSSGGGGGKIVCTMMNKTYGFGSFRNKIWLRQSKDLAPEYQKGYHILFLPLVKIAETNKIIRKILEHIAVHRTIDIRQESRGKTHILGRVYRKVLEPICYLVGKYGKR